MMWELSHWFVEASRRPEIWCALAYTLAPEDCDPSRPISSDQAINATTDALTKIFCKGREDTRLIWRRTQNISNRRLRESSDLWLTSTAGKLRQERGTLPNPLPEYETNAVFFHTPPSDASFEHDHLEASGQPSPEPPDAEGPSTSDPRSLSTTPVIDSPPPRPRREPSPEVDPVKYAKFQERMIKAIASMHARNARAALAKGLRQAPAPLPSPPEAYEKPVTRSQRASKNNQPAKTIKAAANKLPRKSPLLKPQTAKVSKSTAKQAPKGKGLPRNAKRKR